GKIIRAMAYCCNWWESEEPKEDSERIQWRRLEGKPEEWEKEAIKFNEEELTEEIDELKRLNNSTEIELQEKQLRNIWSNRIIEIGSQYPRGVQDMIVLGV